MKSLMRLDPFRFVRKVDPFDELREMQHDMERIFDQFLGRDISSAERRSSAWMPRVEQFTKDNNLVFRCELPGIDPKDLEITVTERGLTIKGERKTEKGTKEEDYLYREIAYGAFERHFELPEGVKSEQMKAKFANGILEVTVPAPAIAKARKIEIEAQAEEAKEVKKLAA
jgi:HSP20 family protein